MAVLAAVIRGFARRGTGALGNFWADLVRITLYILLPLAIVVTLILGSQGVVQTFSDPVELPDPRGAHARRHRRGRRAGRPRRIYRGPVASQIAIKQLGTNGGGYYNANSAVPVREPDAALTNFVEMLLILLIPAALTYTFGIMVGSRGPGLGAVRGDDGRSSSSASPWRCPSSSRAPRCSSQTGVELVGHGRLDRRQPRATRRSASASPTRCSGAAVTTAASNGVGQQRPRRLDRRRRAWCRSP